MVPAAAKVLSSPARRTCIYSGWQRMFAAVFRKTRSRIKLWRRNARGRSSMCRQSRRGAAQ
jgi:hypothetical protein